MSTYDDKEFLNTFTGGGLTTTHRIANYVGCDLTTANCRLKQLADEGEVEFMGGYPSHVTQTTQDLVVRRTGDENDLLIPNRLHSGVRAPFWTQHYAPWRPLILLILRNRGVVAPKLVMGVHARSIPRKVRPGAGSTVARRRDRRIRTHSPNGCPGTTTPKGTAVALRS